jgi:hypothetical protein
LIVMPFAFQRRTTDGDVVDMSPRVHYSAMASIMNLVNIEVESVIQAMRLGGDVPRLGTASAELTAAGGSNSMPPFTQNNLPSLPVEKWFLKTGQGTEW